MTEILLKAVLQQCVQMGLLTATDDGNDTDYVRTATGIAVMTILERFDD
jgi:hypothetical protein